MTIREKVSKLLKSRGLTVADLAKLAGISRTTAHNLLSGRSKSVTARRTLTNAIGVQLWNGVQPVRVPFIVPKGTELEFLDSETMAAAFESEFSGAVKRSGTTIKFLRKTPIEIRPRGPLVAAKKQTPT